MVSCASLCKKSCGEARRSAHTKGPKAGAAQVDRATRHDVNPNLAMLEKLQDILHLHHRGDANLTLIQLDLLKGTHQFDDRTATVHG